jgi:hypothetical protein
MEYSEALTTVKDGRAWVTIGNLSEEPVTLNKNCEVVEPIENFEEQIVDAGRINFGKNLTVSKRQKLGKLIQRHHATFRNKLKKELYASNVRHYIRVRKGSVPVRRRVPFFPPERQKAIGEMVKDLLERDLIEAGNPEWRAPLMVVPKPDGSWRVVVDYRGLNDLTIPDTYPMPNISEILFRLSGAKFFTKMRSKEALTCGNEWQWV